MGVKERVMTCRLLEKMTEQAGYSRQLGLKNTSTFCGVTVIQKKPYKFSFRYIYYSGGGEYEN